MSVGPKASLDSAEPLGPAEGELMIVDTHCEPCAYQQGCCMYAAAGVLVQIDTVTTDFQNDILCTLNHVILYSGHIKGITFVLIYSYVLFICFKKFQYL